MSQKLWIVQIFAVLVCTAAANLTSYHYSGTLVQDDIIQPPTATPAVIVQEANINHWNGSAYYRWEPAGTPGDYYTAIWKGYLWVETPGQYGFGTISDDGSQVFIDDTLVVANQEEQWYDWEDNITEYDAGDPNQPLILSRGFHRLEVRFYEAAYYDGIVFWWLLPDAGSSIPPYIGQTFHQGSVTQNPNTNWQIVPASVLFTNTQTQEALCTADLDLSGYVDLGDFALMAAHWSLTGAGTPGDINLDAVVGLEDLKWLALAWLTNCTM